MRDTLALQERRPVRWLRLGGHAPLPTYFEIAGPHSDEVLMTSLAPARVVLLDDDGAVLLFCGSGPPSPTAPRPGGGSPLGRGAPRSRFWSTPPPVNCRGRPVFASSRHLVGPVAT